VVIAAGANAHVDEEQRGDALVAFALPSFRHAGLPAPNMIAATPVACGPTSLGYENMVRVLRSLLPSARHASARYRQRCRRCIAARCENGAGWEVTSPTP
jgi:hypothetical protein